ncbi:MAG TPA: preprotein translocase subunit SecE [Defluviitaleaceae bacterium]|jgi:preprotein translocase subunit SecE|nr:preprotein translocase subunit SecE [Candidatus Epulonipiscium sp.]HOQ16266.1 preprotein translocase subunit SecE [Defluviitaleaceae bacterium]HPT75579.1 preprotein translocase subunit SecE [Defluviitaleaceae bacterium]HQD49568.1 preprotein translocase subunit SecE [Defluviitaleaceae bacterium]
MKERFLQVKGEFKKIIWPNKKDLVKQTTTVIVTSLLTAGIVFVIDFAYSRGLDKLMEILK